MPPRTFGMIESLEDRRLFAFDNWGDYERLIRLPNAQQALPTITGAGQTVAVIDSGIDYTLPVLGGGYGGGLGSSNKVIGGYDFVDNDNDPLDSTYGHGTEVAGMIAANQFQYGGQTYSGVAPGAKLVALRVDSSSILPGGAGELRVPDSKIEQALQWVMTNRTTFNITVVNISLGTRAYTTNVRSSVYGDEIQALADAGVTVVASSGNTRSLGPGISTPAADPNVISVGSVDTDGTISEFTQRSSILGMLAPGNNVIAPFFSGGGGDAFGTVGGTSYAAPMIAGAVALMRQINPTLVEHDALSILRASGIKTFDGGSGVQNPTGINYPRLDVLAALKLTQARQPADPSLQGLVGKFGNGNSVAVDAQGVTHLVYYDSAAQTMQYATRDSDGQLSITQQIDNSTPFQGEYVSLAIDPLNQPAVAYFDGMAGDLKFARYDGISWNVQVIDSRNSVGLYPSLTFDRNGLAAISYYRKTSGDLKVAREKLDGTFATASIDTHGDVGRSTAIAMDANGRLGIAYEDSGRGFLKYAELPSKATLWSNTYVDKTSRGVAFTSMAYSPADNHPWISYYDPAPANLRVANFAHRGWHVGDVATRGAVGLFTTMLFVDETPAVLYWDKSRDALLLASQQNDNWTTTTLQSNGGRYATATVDSTLEIVRYSYYDTASRTLRLDADAIS